MIKLVDEWSFPTTDLEIIKKDWQTINKKITDAESFAEVLGEDMDTGAKWANFVDVDNDTVSLESGNHLPDIAIKNLHRILCEFDPNVKIIDGEYWEQNYIEVGVFVIDEDGFRFVSTSVLF